jgi:hypothetical protein
VHILKKALKRILVGTLALGLLSACAGVTAPAAARSETPQQSLSATGKEMAKLQSVRFDVTGTVTLTLPQQLVDQLRAKAGSQGSFLTSNMTVLVTIHGAAQRPDKLDATIEARLGGLTVDTEVIAAGGGLYYKDPMDLKWEAVTRPHDNTSGGTKPKLSYQAILDASTLTELNGQPSTLNGVAVDHYRIVPDLAKLFAQLTAGHQSKNPQAMAAIQALLQNASLTADVWTGNNDHLIRRLSYDADVTADLSALAAAFKASSPSPSGGGSGWGFTIPAGSTAHLTAHVVLNLHDFNSRVTIKAPTVAP